MEDIFGVKLLDLLFISLDNAVVLNDPRFGPGQEDEEAFQRYITQVVCMYVLSGLSGLSGLQRQEDKQ